MTTRTAAPSYDDHAVRGFAISAVVWGVVGMAVGLFIAAQLTWPELGAGIPWLSYGRLRPLHTNAVIFAFGSSALFATSYHVVQRTCQVPLFAPALARFTPWGWNAVIVLAAITLPLGYTQSKEYAELEWPIDVLIALAWVAYAIVFFGTIGKRRVRHIYVATWFFASFIVTVAVLHAQTLRYGPYSSAGEFVYDRPFLWGSKRTGPDLHRVGGNYSDEWQRLHLLNPRDLVPESNMPGYPWLERNHIDAADVAPRLRALRRLGVPYSDAEIAAAPEAVKDKTELDALVAYLQGLGTTMK